LLKQEFASFSTASYWKQKAKLSLYAKNYAVPDFFLYYSSAKFKIGTGTGNFHADPQCCLMKLLLPVP
jgi:hypothetical protein